MSEGPEHATARRYMVSPQEAAEMLSVDRETVLRLIRRGELKASRISRKIIRIRLADIEAFAERRSA